MLVLSRRIGESIMVGDDIQIVVLPWRGSQIRLGFIAPQELSIHRQEIYEKIKSKQLEAVNDGTEG